MVKKKLKSIYSLDGLLIRKKSLLIIKVINILRILSSLRFFKVDNYPFDYEKFVRFYNKLVKSIMYQYYLDNIKAYYYYFIDILINNNYFKNSEIFEIKKFLKRYRKAFIYNIRCKIDKFLNLLNHKFKFKKLKKIYYLKKFKYNRKVKKSKKQILRENKKMQFFGNLVKNKKNLLVIHHYVTFRFKDSLKKKFRYFGKQKKNTSDFIRYRFSKYLITKEFRKKKKLLYKK
jgi:hypothetical protein